MGESFFQLLSYLGLLLWGLHMVRSGITRAFGERIRIWLGFRLKTRLMALLSGTLATMVLQSSTATALITGGFVARRYLALSTALIVMLGANIGSSLVAQALAFDTGPFSAFLIVGGYLAFRRSRGPGHAIGRAAIGLGIMLLALHLLTTSVVALKPDASSNVLLPHVAGQTGLMLVLSLVLACVAHSSVAAILVICSLQRSGLVPIASALVMVLGANIGTALNPIVAFWREPEGLRLAVGNIVTRLVGTLILFPIIPDLAGLTSPTIFGGSLPSLFNIGFNVTLALLFLPAAGKLAALLARLMPNKATASDRIERPMHAPSDGSPKVAIARVIQEVLKMVDVLDGMLGQARLALHQRDRNRLREMRRTDDRLDRMLERVERYITGLDPAKFSDDDETRLSSVLIFAINLEHAGDVLERSLGPVAIKALKNSAALDAGLLTQLDSLFDQLVQDLQLGASVFLTGNLDDAKQLIVNKESFREIERAFAEEHFERLYAGSTYGSRSAVLDIARDLKRIEAHVTAVAKPFLADRGLLRDSRLAV